MEGASEQEKTMTIAMVSFAVVMVVMTLSGALSVLEKKKTTDDYLVASRSVPAWLTALSTVGTNNSGFMFIGMIAYTYRVGLQSVWMMAGWLLGDYLAWRTVHPRVSARSRDHGANTLSGLIATEKNRSVNRPLAVVTGLLTVAFLTVYAAAQLKAGSTALHALFGWKMYVGSMVGALIVIVYSYAGGIRADIWTDVAQSLVMLFSMVAILVAGWMRTGSPWALYDHLHAIDSRLVNWAGHGLEFTAAGLALGFVFAGIGVVGQPHLMSRLMALESTQAIGPARRYYFSWFVPFWCASVLVGLYSRVLLPNLANRPVARDTVEPTELALPLMTMELLPQVFIGVALAGLFAAAVSTADSQIIVSSGALTHDIQPKWERSYVASKVGTFLVLGMALVIALFAPESVFALVLIAWSALGATLGSVLIVRMFDLPLSTPVALLMMAAALIVVVAWQLGGWDESLSKAMPGMVAAFAVYGVARLFGDASTWNSAEEHES